MVTTKVGMVVDATVGETVPVICEDPNGNKQINTLMKISNIRSECIVG